MSSVLWVVVSVVIVANVFLVAVAISGAIRRKQDKLTPPSSVKREI